MRARTRSRRRRAHEGKTPIEVANFYIAQFKRDCALLNIELPPDANVGDLPHPPQSALCRATDNVPAMAP